MKDRYGAGSAEAKLALLVRLAACRSALCAGGVAPARAAVLPARLSGRCAPAGAGGAHARSLSSACRSQARARGAHGHGDCGHGNPLPLFLVDTCAGSRGAGRSASKSTAAKPKSPTSSRAALPLLLTWAEAAALKQLDPPAFAAIDRLRARGESDAAFLARRIAAMPGDGFTREAFHDAIEPSLRTEARGGHARAHPRQARRGAVRLPARAAAARAPGAARGTRASLSCSAPGVAARRRAADRTRARRHGHPLARSRRIRLRQCARRAPGRRWRRARVCADRRHSRAARS